MSHLKCVDHNKRVSFSLTTCTHRGGGSCDSKSLQIKDLTVFVTTARELVGLRSLKNG
jgi:hypothetical protein